MINENNKFTFDDLRRHSIASKLMSVRVVLLEDILNDFKRETYKNLFKEERKEVIKLIKDLDLLLNKVESKIKYD